MARLIQPGNPALEQIFQNGSSVTVNIIKIGAFQRGPA